ncbi:MAG: histidine phosphatase family protein [Alphaproteobacteria bacterium]|nr:histidine phosphatase family protein [Alphaproteobacteria bacterium]MDD9920613.1 histidine phosphatase family protein [Alphaproteobacteria bacterium]
MPLPRSFYFIRHGQTDWNVAARLQGHTDVPLNKTGEQQAEDAAPLLKNIPLDIAVTSDLCRAELTAQKSLIDHNIPLHKHTGLRERGFGDWEGQLSAEAKRSAGLNPQARLLDHTGEIIFVAHGYVFVALTLVLIQKDHMCENAIPYHFKKISPNNWEITKLEPST